MPGKTIMPVPPRTGVPVLPPVAQEVATALATMINNSEDELRELRISYEAAKRHIALLEKQLADRDHQCGAYQRYAVEVTLHLDGIGKAIDAAKERALALAKEAPTPPSQVPHTIVENLERDLAEAQALADARKDP